jgi:hypothetical protein
MPIVHSLRAAFSNLLSRIRCTGGAIGHSTIQYAPNQFGRTDPLPARGSANGFPNPSPNMHGESPGITASTIIELTTIEHRILRNGAMPLFVSGRYVGSFSIFSIDVFFRNFLRLKAKSVKVGDHKSTFAVTGQIGS